MLGERKGKRGERSLKQTDRHTHTLTLRQTDRQLQNAYPDVVRSIEAIIPEGVAFSDQNSAGRAGSTHRVDSKSRGTSWEKKKKKKETEKQRSRRRTAQTKKPREREREKKRERSERTSAGGVDAACQEMMIAVERGIEPGGDRTRQGVVSTTESSSGGQRYSGEQSDKQERR
jgi:hypothetical protein